MWRKAITLMRPVWREETPGDDPPDREESVEDPGPPDEAQPGGGSEEKRERRLRLILEQYGGHSLGNLRVARG